MPSLITGRDNNSLPLCLTNRAIKYYNISNLKRNKVCRDAVLSLESREPGINILSTVYPLFCLKRSFESREPGIKILSTVPGTLYTRHNVI
jgi:hypothetical protein